MDYLNNIEVLHNKAEWVIHETGKIMRQKRDANKFANVLKEARLINQLSHAIDELLYGVAQEKTISYIISLIPDLDQVPVSQFNPVVMSITTDGANGSVSSFKDLDDVQAPLVANKWVRVNASGDGLVYEDLPVPPPPPTSDSVGISFKTRPGAPSVSAGEVTETPCEVTIDGDDFSVPSLNLIHGVTSEGFERVAMTAVNCNLGSPAYELIFGAIVAVGETLVYPSLPDGYLFVRWIRVNHNEALIMTDPVRFVEYPDGEAQYPDDNGKLIIDGARIVDTSQMPNFAIPASPASEVASSDTAVQAIGKLQRQVNDANTAAVALEDRVLDQETFATTAQSDITELLAGRWHPYAAKFDTTLILPDVQYFTGRYEIADNLPDKISSVAYYTRIYGEASFTSRANLAAVQTWINTLLPTSSSWELKRVPTANASAGLGECAISVLSKKI